MKRQSCYRIGTSQLICSANQLTGFCMMATLAFKELSFAINNIAKLYYLWKVAERI